MEKPIARIIDLIDPASNDLGGFTDDEARALILSGEATAAAVLNRPELPSVGLMDAPPRRLQLSPGREGA